MDTSRGRSLAGNDKSRQASAYRFSRFAAGFCSEVEGFFRNEEGLERILGGVGQILYSFWRNSSRLGKTLPVSAKTCTGLARSGQGFVGSRHLAAQTVTFSRKSRTKLGRRCHFLGKCFPLFGKQVQLLRAATGRRGYSGDWLAHPFRRGIWRHRYCVDRAEARGETRAGDGTRTRWIVSRAPLFCGQAVAAI